MKKISAEGGVLIYLDQEGRGIGLRSKVLAYSLQDRGMDTFAANRALGFPDDARSFEPAARMMLALGLTEVRLMTNNPDKVEQIRRCGIEIIEIVPTPVFRTADNDSYLKAKRAAGHNLSAENPTPEPARWGKPSCRNDVDMASSRLPVA